jgi:nucleotide-binding universal stress UspA family protein
LPDGFLGIRSTRSSSCRVAAGLDHALHVFRVPVTMPAMTADGGVLPLNRTALTEGYRETLNAELERVVASVAASHVTIHRAVMEGDVVREILKQARAGQANLVVMGTHGRSGFERLLLGSVTERMLRKAPCPVLTVPRRTTETLLTFKRILCPIDFSDSSQRALAYALSLAQEADAHLIVANVVELLPESDTREYRILDLLRIGADSSRRRASAPAVIPEAARTTARSASGHDRRRTRRSCAWQARDVDLIVTACMGGAWPT